jgi:hypothetical protein
LNCGKRRRPTRYFAEDAFVFRERAGHFCGVLIFDLHDFVDDSERTADEPAMIICDSMRRL